MLLPFTPLQADWRSILSRAKSRVCSVDRVLCGILLSLQPVETRGLGTLGVTKDGKLIVDPAFILESTSRGADVSTLVRVLIHEALHVLFLHPERCEKLPDKQLCNLAADAIVEATIDETIRSDRNMARVLGLYANGVITAPRLGSEYHRSLGLLKSILEECGVAWSEVTSHTLEQLYERLESCIRAEAKAASIKIDVHRWGGEAAGESRGAGGAGGEEGGRRDRLEEIARLARNLAEEAAGASAITSKLPGVVPGEWERLLEELGVIVRLDWRQTLQRLLDQVVPGDYTWRRPSRRSEALGVLLPGVLKRAWRIAVVLDTSGSISDDEYREFIEALYQLLVDKPVEELIVAEADVEIHTLEVYVDPSPLLVKRRLLRRVGYGGTSFAKTLHQLFEKFNTIDLVIYFTDGYGVYPDEPPPAPIVWVISREGVRPGNRIFWPPFGYVIHMADGRLYISKQDAVESGGDQGEHLNTTFSP